MLDPKYRGQGAGHVFFDLREKHAADLGMSTTAFCAVDRPPTHHARPPGYRSHENFWSGRGYKKRSDLRTVLPWKEVGQSDSEPEILHDLTFWLRDRQF